jgi:hypothetical protein
MAEPADWIDPLHGYAFDSFNPDALLHLATVRQGRIVLPGGASYAVLVWPGAQPLAPDPGMMSAAVARRLLQLVEAGATVLIDGPAADRYHATGLSHTAEDDSTVRQVVRRLLGGRVGKGRVIVGPFRDSSFDGIPKDFIAEENTERATGIGYTHRAAPGLDIYFVSNQLDRPRALDVSLRVEGREPELWDPVTGGIVPTHDWTSRDGRTLLPLRLPPNGSIFIVLSHPGSPTHPVATAAVASPAQLLQGPWTVHFDPMLGGPSADVIFDSLQDWSKNRDSSICYYSGTAVYRKSFDATVSLAQWKGSRGRVWLDLGEVANIARVRVNGVDCGVAWTAPYRVDITAAIRPGANDLQIEVTNTWANRLTGDHSLPEGKRITWTTAPYHPDGKLLRAGLLGPVKIGSPSPLTPILSLRSQSPDGTLHFRKAY